MPRDAPASGAVEFYGFDITIDLLVQSHGLNEVRAAVMRAANRRVGRPLTKNAARILHAWVEIEAVRLRERCSAGEACRRLAARGGLYIPTKISPGGIGDLVVPVKRTADVPEERGKIITRAETLRDYHKLGAGLIKSMPPEAAAAWRDMALVLTAGEK